MIKYKAERTFPQLTAVFSLMVLLIVVASTISNYVQIHLTRTFLPHVSVAFTAPNGELIGVSDGSSVFDTNRLDGQVKSQAATRFRNGDALGANALWSNAVATDVNDAEAQIYLEDQRVLASGHPYITLIVGTIFTGDPSAVSVGRNTLKGAYVAQKEYNDGFKLSGGMLVRLLIANAGSRADYASIVSQQIVQVAQQDRTIVGVMGWPFSSYTLNAIAILSKAGIPMVSSAASADELTSISPFFFRVVPPDRSQGIAGAHYAEQGLQAKRVAIFSDPSDAYSNTLATAFSEQFIFDGNQTVEEHYTVGKSDTLFGLVQDALNFNPDLIYFAGYPNDLVKLLIDLPASTSIRVMGGDALSTLNSSVSSTQLGLNRLSFTTFYSPDEWYTLEPGEQMPAFFSEYTHAFSPDALRSDVATIRRVNTDSVLSYDATIVLLQACRNALLGREIVVTTGAVQQGLKVITGRQAIQGVSGQISFGSNGDPINKAIIILSINSTTGDIIIPGISGIQGCFLVGKC